MSKNKKTCFNCRTRAVEDHDLLLRYAGQAIPAVVERHALDGHVHDEATVARDAVALARALIAEAAEGGGVMGTCKDQTSQGYCEDIRKVLDALNKHKALDRDVTNKILSPAERVDSLGRHRDFLLLRIDSLLQRLDPLRTEVERLTRERDEAIRQIGPLAAENERLRGALEALGAMPDGYCFCSTGRDPDKAHHEPECRDARAALAGEGQPEGRRHEP